MCVCVCVFPLKTVAVRTLPGVLTGGKLLTQRSLVGVCVDRLSVCFAGDLLRGCCVQSFHPSLTLLSYWLVVFECVLRESEPS